MTNIIEIYIKYSLPVFMISIISIALIRDIRKYNQKDNKQKREAKRKILVTSIITLLLTFLLVSAITIVLLSGR